VGSPTAVKTATMAARRKRMENPVRGRQPAQ
jgi:hypothetical protein